LIYPSQIMPTLTNKKKKCNDLELKVSRMWTVRTKIVPVIIGALGTSKKGLDKVL